MARVPGPRRALATAVGGLWGASGVTRERPQDAGRPVLMDSGSWADAARRTAVGGFRRSRAGRALQAGGVRSARPAAHAGLAWFPATRSNPGNRLAWPGSVAPGRRCATCRPGPGTAATGR